ncbi:hypothetical protein HMPREF9371_0172 [Neisseria shayeganii 871]|uniref:Uncharacterized protein n=1 Tax=Neisseria shayeganii 871 TaxID=1032488 RepID=G4CEY3_9NEIS|nr:hypothetical protein HMPREF9371_0172 [Neisseria shayeganii 871]
MAHRLPESRRRLSGSLFSLHFSARKFIMPLFWPPAAQPAQIQAAGASLHFDSIGNIHEHTHFLA